MLKSSRCELSVVTFYCVLLGVMAATGCAYCQAAEGDHKVVTKTEVYDGALAELEGFDYSDLIAKLDYSSPLQEMSGAAFASSRELQKLDLTELELKHVGVLRLGGTQSQTLYTTVMFVTKYAKQHSGELPANGMELFAKNFSDDETAQEFFSMSPLDQLRVAGHGVNLITGKFYTTFQATEWMPGGLLIEPVTDHRDLHGRFSSYVDSQTGGRPGVWRVVVYGETPGSVLVDKMLALNVTPRDFPMPRETSSQVKPKK